MFGNRDKMILKKLLGFLDYQDSDAESESFFSSQIHPSKLNLTD